VRPIPARPTAVPHIVGPAPDDDEHDPGARPTPSPSAHEPGGEDEEPTAPVTHVDPHDDVAWGQGPTVLKSVGFNRARRPDGRRNKSRRRPDASAPPAASGRSPVAAPTGPAEGAPTGDPRARRKGRQRRRGRRDGAGTGQEVPPRPAPVAPAVAPSGGDRPPVEGAPSREGGGERPGGGRRRRRRRGRR
jgi:hypothetical protein